MTLFKLKLIPKFMPLLLTLVIASASGLSAAQNANRNGLEWWTSYQSCDIQPVNEPQPKDDGAVARLGRPYVSVDMGDLDAYGFFFTGSRPFPINGDFANGDIAKVLWVFPERVRGFTITGTLLDENGEPNSQTVSVIDSNESLSTEWPSKMAFPESGCWSIELKATSLDEVELRGTFQFIVVD